MPTTRDDDFLQVNPCFSNKISLLVVIKNGALELVVVQGIVHDESEFLIPAFLSASLLVRGSHFCLPSWCLTTSFVCVGLFCFLTQPHGTVRILLAHCLSVGQVLRSVDDGNQGSNLWAIKGHIGKDTCRMGSIDCSSRFGCHLEVLKLANSGLREGRSGGVQEVQHARLPGLSEGCKIGRTQESMAGTIAEKKRDRGGCRKGCCCCCSAQRLKSSQVVERVFTQDQSGHGASHGNLRG